MLPEFFIDRVESAGDANESIGEMVTDNEPNVNEPGIYRDRETGEAVLVYAPFPGDLKRLRKSILDTAMSTTLRSNGMRNLSRTFGMAARSVVLKRESCRPASLAWENPEAQMTLNATASDLGKFLKSVLPEIYEEDEKVVDQVLPEWRMTEDSLWTSGVINSSSQLPYHRDRANFETWSAMPVLRRNMKGGHLTMPEYGITINCRDGYALWFNGNKYVHGVTPMNATSKDGYRYSIVFYALRGMKDCHTYAVEVGEARKKRTERENAMVDSSAEQIGERIKTGRSSGSTKIAKG
jgi:hypothetical protein